jgi:CarD family transcriptional regulator
VSYAPGDKLVHPQHGVGAVDGPPTKASNGISYLHLFFERSSLRISIPVDSLDDVGIRPLSTRAHAQRILATLEEDAEVSTEWSERNADTVARVKSTDLDQAALVIRDLTRHEQRATKALSAAEKGALERCMDMVAQELSLVLDMTVEETRALIDTKIGTAAEDDGQGGDAPVAV